MAAAVAIALVAGALIGVAVMALTRSGPPEAVPVAAADDDRDERLGSTARRADRGAATTVTTETDPVMTLPSTTVQVPPVLSPVTPDTTAVATQRLTPATAHASCQSPDGVDAADNTMSYPPIRAVDGDVTTVWRCDGDGANQWIEVHFTQAVELSELGIVVGFNKIDPVDGSDRFLQGRRVSAIRVELDDGSSHRFDLADDRSMQWLPLSGSTRTLRVVVTASRPGSAITNDRGERLPPTDKTPIAELSFNGRHL